MLKHLVTFHLDTKVWRASKKPKINIHRGGIETTKAKEDRDNNVIRNWKLSITSNAANILNKKRTEARLVIAYWFAHAKHSHWL